MAPNETWEFRVITHTDPLCPFEYYANVTNKPEEFGGSYLNQAFFRTSDCFKVHTAAEITNCFLSFQGACETYRINALSTTGVFVGASVTDQGTILSSQFVDATREVACKLVDSTKDACAIGCVWVDPLPPMSEASLGQRPYVADARKGWYAPQKLMAPGHWQRTNDIARRGRLTITGNPTEFNYTDCMAWPASYGAANGMPIWFRPYDDSCSQTFAKGLSPTTSFRVTIRMVLEMGVTPNNDFAAFASDPLPPDDTAFELYLAMVNELMDAYPAEYNDLNKIWGKIKEIGKKVATFIDPVAGIAAAVGVPYAKAVQGIARGLSGSAAQKYIDAERDGLAAAVDSIRAEKAARAAIQDQKAKAKMDATKKALAAGGDSRITADYLKAAKRRLKKAK